MDTATREVDPAEVTRAERRKRAADGEEARRAEEPLREAWAALSGAARGELEARARARLGDAARFRPILLAYCLEEMRQGSGWNGPPPAPSGPPHPAEPPAPPDPVPTPGQVAALAALQALGLRARFDQWSPGKRAELLAPHAVGLDPGVFRVQVAELRPRSTPPGAGASPGAPPAREVGDGPAAGSGPVARASAGGGPGASRRPCPEAVRGYRRAGGPA